MKCSAERVAKWVGGGRANRALHEVRSRRGAHSPEDTASRRVCSRYLPSSFLGRQGHSPAAWGTPPSHVVLSLLGEGPTKWVGERQRASASSSVSWAASWVASSSSFHPNSRCMIAPISGASPRAWSRVNQARWVRRSVMSLMRLAASYRTA